MRCCRTESAYLKRACISPILNNYRFQTGQSSVEWGTLFRMRWLIFQHSSFCFVRGKCVRACVWFVAKVIEYERATLYSQLIIFCDIACTSVCEMGVRLNQSLRTHDDNDYSHWFSVAEVIQDIALLFFTLIWSTISRQCDWNHDGKQLRRRRDKTCQVIHIPSRHQLFAVSHCSSAGDLLTSCQTEVEHRLRVSHADLVIRTPGLQDSRTRQDPATSTATRTFFSLFKSCALCTFTEKSISHHIVLVCTWISEVFPSNCDHPLHRLIHDRFLVTDKRPILRFSVNAYEMFDEYAGILGVEHFASKLSRFV